METVMANDECRKAFEVWCKTELSEGRDHYALSAWEAWQAAWRPRATIPTTAEDIRSFIGSKFSAIDYAGKNESDPPSDDDTYVVSANDLISAFVEWDWSQSAAPKGGE